MPANTVNTTRAPEVHSKACFPYNRPDRPQKCSDDRCDGDDPFGFHIIASIACKGQIRERRTFATKSAAVNHRAWYECFCIFLNLLIIDILLLLLLLLFASGKCRINVVTWSFLTSDVCCERNARVFVLTRTRSLETSCHFSSFDHITAASETTILTHENNDETVKDMTKPSPIKKMLSQVLILHFRYREYKNVFLKQYTII